MSADEIPLRSIFKWYDDVTPWKRFPHCWSNRFMFPMLLSWTSCRTNSLVAGGLKGSDAHVTSLWWVAIWNIRWEISPSNDQHGGKSWWRHQMETFSPLLSLCARNSPVTGEFPSPRPVTRSFEVFYDLRLNKRLSKQSRRLWLDTPSRSLWCHCNVLFSPMRIYMF